MKPCDRTIWRSSLPGYARTNYPKPLSQAHLHCLFLEAYQWLCRSRKKHPPSSDVWDLRRSWKEQADALLVAFESGDYQMSVQKKMALTDGETIAVWSSRDALVVKVLTWIIEKRLKPALHKTCYHLKRHGGLKGAVRDVFKGYRRYRFFCKTDVRNYYSSIDHYTLLMKLHDHIGDRQIINYVWQFLNRCVEWGGLYQDMRRGIPRGSSLSPLLGAFYLLDLDREMEKMDVKYFRYMDDVLILAPTRWKLKRAIQVLSQTFNELKLEKHPEKTSIGKIERGFDFLGYHFSPKGLSLAKKTAENFLARALRLYEQKPGEPFDPSRLGEYVQRWFRWVRGGLPAGRLTRPALHPRVFPLIRVIDAWVAVPLEGHHLLQAKRIDDGLSVRDEGVRISLGDLVAPLRFHGVDESLHSIDRRHIILKM
jgi:RNA-directed DNA polymerase